MRRTLIVFIILIQICFLSVGIYLTYQGDPAVRLSGLMTIVTAQTIIVIILLFENYVLGRALALSRAAFAQEEKTRSVQWASFQAEIKEKITTETNLVIEHFHEQESTLRSVDTRLAIVESKTDPDEIKIRKTINGTTSSRLSAVVDPATEATTPGTKGRGRRGKNTVTSTGGSAAGTILATSDEAAAE